MSNNDDIQGMFFEECDDLLEALFEGLALLENQTAEDDTINAIFRSVHSIKGGAGAFNLEELVSFSHKFETVLDELRAERIATTDALIFTLFSSADHLAHLVEAAREKRKTDLNRGKQLISELNKYVESDGLDTAGESDFCFEPTTISINIPSSERSVCVRFRPFRQLYLNGHDPFLLIEALREHTEVSVDIDLSDLGTVEEFDKDDPKLTFLIFFSADNPKEILEDVFEFVDGICLLELNEIDEDDLNSETEGLDHVEMSKAETSQTESETSGGPAAPNERDKSGKTEIATAQPTLRVELGKIDRLINTVGELIINQAMIAQHIDQLDLPSESDLETEMNDYKVLARDLQEGVMSIRAQPVKTLFQRMARITREAASATEKSVRMNTIGEATEVDKTVIERLADPLTHMIRNAVDHGLESREDRIKGNKPETGVITLKASHSSGNVLIEISDDGAGLNRKKILEIAVSKNLVAPGLDLTDSEIDNLLFLPGFSTNSEVSKLSGRGVGMDVVKRGVEALGGRISIASRPGEGTKFSIVLPLTLAVMDGIVVSVAKEVLIVPITAVVETLRPDRSEIFELGKDQKVLMIRGEYVPIVSVRKKLKLSQNVSAIDEQVLVLIEGIDQKRCALCVDSIHDQRQVVIKAVGGHYGKIPGVSAATIMGDGKIALILDAEHISSMAPADIPLQGQTQQEHRTLHD